MASKEMANNIPPEVWKYLATGLLGVSLGLGGSVVNNNGDKPPLQVQTVSLEEVNRMRDRLTMAIERNSQVINELRIEVARLRERMELTDKK